VIRNQLNELVRRRVDLGLRWGARGKREWRGRRCPFAVARHRERREEGRWGSSAGGATRRKKQGRLGLNRATWMEDGVGGLAAGKARGRRRQASVGDVRAGEERVPRVGRA
jgi:hypothetical protein